LSALRLPAILAGLFVIQNQIFNIFVHLSPNQYLFQSVLISFSLGMLLYGPAELLPKIWRTVYLLAVSLVVAFLFIAQYLYFSYFGGFMQASVLGYAGQADAVKSTILSIITPLVFVFLLQFFVIFAWGFSEKKGKIKRTILLKKEKIRAAFALFLIGLFGYGFVLFGEGNGWSKITNLSQTIHEMNSFVYSPNDTVERTGIFNYCAGDMIGFIFRKTKLTKDDLASVGTWEEEKTRSKKQ